ncbi:MAG: trimeric intracellular cation channel family protein [Spirochaetales bacterium]|nr:trimeric intracellular cation channel family protein [Spirochaetales bacterium]
MILFILDLAGTAIFAITGALKAIRHKLDWLGILVLAAITGVGGGVFRDLILGNTPPAAFQNEAYLILSLVAAILIIILFPLLTHDKAAPLRQFIMVGDAIGLGVFTFIGAYKGLEAGLGPVGVLFTGAVTSCGGGMIRDMLVKEIPALLKKDFYATASIMGSLLFLGLNKLGLPTWLVPFTVVFFTTSLRLFAMKMALSLPIPHSGKNKS